MDDAMSRTQTQSEDCICISSIALSVPQQFGRPIDYIWFKTQSGCFSKEIGVQVSPGGEHKEVFDDALELPTEDRLSVSIRYRSWPMRGKQQNPSLTVELREVETKVLESRDGKTVCYKLDENMVTISVPCSNPAASASLPEVPLTTISIADDVLSICPRFRVLVIGNSGDGKSTLIQKGFGITEVDVSGTARGHANIDREFVAGGNMPFVLHDSLGFEAGENTTIDKVKHFISQRRTMKDLKDRLHAVWVCVAVPYANGRFLEAGTEEILRSRKEILGDVPVVVVLTKVDLLDRMLLVTLCTDGVVIKSPEEARSIIEPQRSSFLRKHCVQPLVDLVNCNIPHVVVSAETGFGLESTIPELLETTASEIEQYIKTDPSYTAVANRLNEG